MTMAVADERARRHHPRLRTVIVGGGHGRSPAFTHLQNAHALVAAGNALLSVALADSLFFSISPTAARSRVALYLLLTMAPFAVVAPLIGPAIDRARGGRRLMVISSAAGRGGLCVLMAVHLQTPYLFPEAFAVLVLAKAHTVAKSSLVPATTVDDDLVAANARLALTTVIAGAAGAVPGALVARLLGGPAALVTAAVVFVAAAPAGFRVDVRSSSARTSRDRHGVRRADAPAAVRRTSTAMFTARAAMGFFSFLMAFSLRRADAATWWYAYLVVATSVGVLLGNVLAPRLRRRVDEVTVIVSSVSTGAVVAAAVVLLTTRAWVGVLALTLGATGAAAKLAFDALIQRDVPVDERARFFARYETRLQLVWVAAAIVPVAVPVPANLGFGLIAATSVAAAAATLKGRGAADDPVTDKRPRRVAL